MVNYRALRQTELGNTVGQYTARLMKSLENRYLIAKLCQISRTGKTCRAGTDNSNFLSVGLFRLWGYKTVLSGPVCHETLQLSDGNGLTLDSADALAFALALLGAYTAADSRKGRRLGNDLCRLLEIAFFHFADKAGDVDGNGTSAHTSGIVLTL